MTLRSFALPALLAGAVGLAGCGGGDDVSGASGPVDAGDPQALLARTFSDTAKVKSATVEVALQGTIAGKQSTDGKASATLVFDRTDEDASKSPFSLSGEVDATRDGEKIALQGGASYVDSRFYVNWDGQDYDLGESLSERAADLLRESTGAGSSKSPDLIERLGLEPRTWLKDPTVEGEEDVAGTPTYKVTGAVDVAAMVPDLVDASKEARSLLPLPGVGDTSEQLTDADVERLERSVQQLDVTVWTGKDDAILRKLEIDAKTKDERSSIDGTLTVTLTGVGEPQDIAAPSDTKPVSELMSKIGPMLGLGGLFGSGGPMGGPGAMGSGGSTPGAGSAPSSGSGSTSGTGSSSGAGASSGSNGSQFGSVEDREAAQAFIACVQAAGDDRAKVEACRDELTAAR